MLLRAGIVWLALGLAAGGASFGDADWDREAYEEPAGGSFVWVANPEDGVYGGAVGDGTWLKGAPVFGDYFMGFFHSDLEQSWYANLGMTLRLMPRWRLAPFVGAGGSYNQSLSAGRGGPGTLEDGTEVDDLGRSFWGGHVEAGARLWLPNRVQLIEVFVRQTWTTLDGDREYWLVGLATGTGF
jgi:hypothetical protein